MNILNTAKTKFGELWDKSLLDLAIDAGTNALSGEKVDNCIVACNFYSGDLASALSKALEIPSVRIVGGLECAGANAVSLANGKSLVIGVEKMSDLVSSDLTEQTMKFYGSDGVTLDSQFAMVKKALGKDAECEAFSALMHKNAADNKLAQYPFEITADAVSGSPYIADPLHVLECASLCDGAAAVVLGDGDGPELVGSGVGHDVGLPARKDLSIFSALENAKSAINGEVAYAEIHDSYSVGGVIVKDSLDLSCPINMTGGLKAHGHPWAATGVRQIVDVCSQIKSGEVGIAQTMNGACLSTTINVVKG